MENQILDDIKSLKKDNKQPPNFMKWVSIIALWIGIVMSFSYGYIWELQYLIGFLLLVLASITTYIEYEIGAKITLAIITLGVTTLVRFLPFSYTIGFGLGSISVHFEMYLLTFGIVHYFTNRRVLSRLIRGLTTSESSEEDHLAIEDRRIRSYKTTFAKKNIRELEATSKNENLIPEARKAALELLDERKRENPQS